jgi:predicted metal-dependent enzyme (double-stranded beta helix superfamily)
MPCWQRRAELFPASDFAMPETQGRNHILEVEDNDGLGLYLTIGLPGKEAAPHDHGIWCVNAAISGRERHIMWRRTDDGSKPGHATIERIGEVMVEPGHGFAMANHDIHSTEVVGDAPAIGLALYGFALARFPSVVWYHPGFASVRPMPSKRGPGAA